MQQLKLSYKTAQDARSNIEMMPDITPNAGWRTIVVELPGHATVLPLVLHYRCPVDTLRQQLRNPFLASHMTFVPRREYDASGGRVFSEPITGDWHWEVQVRK
jgi:hypothetical protein